MKKRLPIMWRVVALVVLAAMPLALALLPLPSAAVPVFAQSTLYSYDGNGWTVEDADPGAENPEGVFNDFLSCSGDLTKLQVGEYVTYDLGSSYVIDKILLRAEAFNNAEVYLSPNNVAFSLVVGTGTTSCLGGEAEYEITPFQARYIKFYSPSPVVTGKVDIDYFGIHTTTLPTETPFPTASPPPTQPIACITVTPQPTSTRQPTPTPFGLTPLPTSTPITATPTATPAPGFVSDISKFQSTLSPWTALISTRPGAQNATWSSEIGPDTLSGAAFLPYTIDYDGVISTTSAPSGAIIFVRAEGFPTPIRLTGNFKSDPVQQFHDNYVRVLYLDPDYNGVGQAAFVHVGIRSIGSVWSQLDFTILPGQFGGSGKVTAIIIDGVASGTPVESQGGLTSYGYTFDGRQAGAFADDVRFYAGANAIATSFPVCQGSGPTGPPPVPTKTCTIRLVNVDVYSGCKTPESVIDLIGWLSYWFCRVWRFFSFLNENRAQLQAIMDRQALAEPIGTLNELDEAFAILKDIFASVGNTYNTADYRAVNWSGLLDWSFLDRPILPSTEDISPSTYMGSCPTELANVSQVTSRSACYIVYILRSKMSILGFMQWALDIIAVLGFLYYVAENWFAKNG